MEPAKSFQPGDRIPFSTNANSARHGGQREEIQIVFDDDDGGGGDGGFPDRLQGQREFIAGQVEFRTKLRVQQANRPMRLSVSETKSSSKLSFVDVDARGRQQ